MNEFSSFLRKYAKEDFLRLFMPGHQGKCLYLNKNISPLLDLTEIKGADNLFFPDGIIKKLEDLISNLFCSDCYISTGGSTSLIQTILWLFKEKEFIVQRGAHYSFFNAAGIFSIEPIIIGDYRFVSILEIENALLKTKKGAVLFLTSPNYYGEILDIIEIKKICEKFGAILIVDSAHGAHLRFLKENKNPIFLGADVCCCSFHKTLPALTGSAVLQIRKGLFKREVVKKAMALFLTSSPSYLIMDSIGLCLDWLLEFGFSAFLELEEKREKFIKSLNLNFLKTDPSKLVLDCSNLKLDVLDVVDFLRSFKIEPEFYNFRFICFIVSPFLKEENWEKLSFVLKKLETKKEEQKKDFKFDFKRDFGLKEALFKEKETVDVDDACGRVFADIVFFEIPGVLVLTYGEIITKEIVLYLKEKGVKKITVLK